MIHFLFVALRMSLCYCTNAYDVVKTSCVFEKGSCHLFLPLKIFRQLCLNLQDALVVSVKHGLWEGKTFLCKAWLSPIDSVEIDATVYIQQKNLSHAERLQVKKLDSSEICFLSSVRLLISRDNSITLALKEYLKQQNILLFTGCRNFVKYRSETIPIDVLLESGKIAGRITKDTNIICFDETDPSQSSFATYDGDVLNKGIVPCHRETFWKIKEIMDSLSLKSTSSLAVPNVVGLLLSGPPGVGKTSTVRMVAHYYSVPFFEFHGNEIHRYEYLGQAEETLRNLFGNARRCSLAIVFIDELDGLCPKRSKSSSNVVNRMTSQLTSLLDALSNSKTTHGKILFIGATNKPFVIDSALRRPGRLDIEIILLPFNEKERKQLVEQFLDIYPMEKSSECLEKIVQRSNGFVGADFSYVFHETLNNFGLGRFPNDTIPQLLLKSVTNHSPSVLRGPFSIETQEMPKIGWNDIGGYSHVKRRLQMAIEWPRQHATLWKHFNLHPPRGILLRGPPGCCKTTLVKAAANESNLPLLYLSGAELYSCFLGESETILRTAFEVARTVSPSILFIDELDSVLGKRELQNEGNLVKDRLLSTFLTEMDGIVTNAEVTVLGATNRSDLLDDALLRPGRFDDIIDVDIPNESDRKEMLVLFLKGIISNLEQVDWKYLLQHTNGWSGADIRENLEGQEIAQLIETTFKSN